MKHSNIKSDNEFFKCCSCGKFISYDKFITGKIVVEHTPDTNFTSEVTNFYHKECYDDLIHIEDLGFIRTTPEELEKNRCKAKDYLFK